MLFCYTDWLQVKSKLPLMFVLESSGAELLHLEFNDTQCSSIGCRCQYVSSNGQESVDMFVSSGTLHSQVVIFTLLDKADLQV